MNARTFLTATALAFAASQAATPEARAQPSEVDALIERGVQLREQGKDDLALEQFTRAFQISHGPRAQAQLALAEQALGRWVAAEGDMVAALAATGDAWMARNRKVLEKALSTIREHVGDLELRGGIAGADVLVNGSRVASLPLDRPLRVEAGTSFVELRAPGYYPVIRRITITPNGTSREAIDMRPMSSGFIGPGAAPARVEEAKGAPVVPPLPSATDARFTPASTRRTLAWVAAGSAGALAGLGAVALVAHDAKARAYNDDPTCPGTESGAQPASCDGAMSAARTWKTVSIASFVGAGALAVTSGVLFMAEPERRSPSTSFACSPSLGLDITCRLQF